MSVVYLNGKFAAQPITGVQRFAKELIIAMDGLLSSGDWEAHVDFVLLVPAGHSSSVLPHLLKIRVQELPGTSLHAWEQLKLPMATCGSLLINLSGSAPLFKKNQICTFHDAAVFDIPWAYKAAFGRWYRFLFRAQSHLCRRVLTVSEFSKLRLCHHLKLPLSSIAVVPNGATHVEGLAYDDSVMLRLALTRNNYLLAVGSDNPSKNLAALISAFTQLDMYPNARLVVVGGSNSAVFASSHKETTLDPRIIRTGRVSDAQLKALYCNAQAFVFPSLYEGFGIPPIEAMSCGCPVLASTRASIPEVCGDAAAYFEPQNISSIAMTLRQALENPGWLRGLGLAGQRRAERFTWKQAAKCLLSELATLGVVQAAPARVSPVDLNSVN